MEAWNKYGLLEIFSTSVQITSLILAKFAPNMYCWLKYMNDILFWRMAPVLTERLPKILKVRLTG